MPDLPQNMSGMKAPDAPMTGAGLMPNSGMERPQPAPGQAPAPEEQDAYNRLVSASVAMTISPKMRQSVEKALSGQDRARGIATVAAGAVARVATQMRKSKAGASVTDDVIIHGLNEVLMKTAELAEADGQPISDQDMMRAAALAFDMARVTLQQAGMIDRKAMEADLAEVQQNPAMIDQMIGGMA